MCLKKTLIALILAVLFLGLNSNSSYAYVIDGDLSDWGVTPFTDWAPDSSTADWNEEDDISHPYPEWPRTSGFWESRDLEALYFDNDQDYVYWAMVSSCPFSGSGSPRPEDLAIDADGDGFYEFGLDVALLDARTDNGAPIQKGVYDMTSWYSSSGIDYMIKNGTQIGTYDIFNRFLGEIEPWDGTGPEPHDVNSGFGWTPDTYVLEGRIDRMLFGGLDAGDTLALSFAKYECITDYIRLNGTIDDGGNGDGVIPEPSSMILLGAGLLGAGFIRKKK